MTDATTRTHAQSAGHAFGEFLKSVRLAIVHDGVESVVQSVRKIQDAYGDDDHAGWTMAEATVRATGQQIACAMLPQLAWVFCTELPPAVKATPPVGTERFLAAFQTSLGQLGVDASAEAVAFVLERLARSESTERGAA